jgi:H+/gluconate symporter-like permease
VLKVLYLLVNTEAKLEIRLFCITLFLTLLVFFEVGVAIVYPLSSSSNSESPNMPNVNDFPLIK